ncbi:hypothetical protein M3Y99_00595900 [Aphelenchoides fujianensis]|nr:hypothetical protein M3Y99_00595900 [Aphelenchoides fujianensis]
MWPLSFCRRRHTNFVDLESGLGACGAFAKSFQTVNSAVLMSPRVVDVCMSPNPTTELPRDDSGFVDAAEANGGDRRESFAQLFAKASPRPYQPDGGDSSAKRPSLHGGQLRISRRDTRSDFFLEPATEPPRPHSVDLVVPLDCTPVYAHVRTVLGPALSALKDAKDEQEEVLPFNTSAAPQAESGESSGDGSELKLDVEEEVESPASERPTFVEIMLDDVPVQDGAEANGFVRPTISVSHLEICPLPKGISGF